MRHSWMCGLLVLAVAAAGTPSAAHDAGKALSVRRAGVIDLGKAKLDRKATARVIEGVVPFNLCTPQKQTLTLPVPQLCDADEGWRQENGVRYCSQDWVIEQEQRFSRSPDGGLITILCVETRNEPVGEPYGCGPCQPLFKVGDPVDEPILWEGPLPDPWGDPGR